MAEPVELTRAQARRIAVRAQGLEASDRPVGVVDAVRRLTIVQVAPYADVAPTADLVLWSRLGPTYEPDDLQRAVEGDRALVEFDMFVRPVEDLALFLAAMREAPEYPRSREWLELNDDFRRDLLDELADRGPLRSTELPDSARFPWSSSGWTHERNVPRMLELLMLRGEVAVAGREGPHRLWDLAERVYPEGLVAVPAEEAIRIRGERRLRALGIARARGTAVPGEPIQVGDVGIDAVVEGVKGRWRVDPDALAGADAPLEPRTALLSPLDRLVFDRKRALELFDYEYAVEMYKPKAKRRWGYYALPILHGDRLVGKLDASADRDHAVLRVNAVHEDVAFDREVRAAVEAEIRALAGWLGLRVVRA